MADQPVIKPFEVRVAVKILYLTLIFSVVSTLIIPETDMLLEHIPKDQHHGIKLIFWFALLMMYVIYFYIIHAINRGKNWARITYVTLFFIWFFAFLIGIDHLLNYPSHLLLPIVQMVLNMVALFLLFQTHVGQWFSRMEKI
ncbi:hypothetical protein L3V79_08870 [Thiotrichales bacterium 19S9-12]|nr:hypothetical protein [Thiotrichales bacterium 19S9-11]MCF6812468.1 hypothetical protein [Thiotrichales bacterium 19S9-12]